MSNQKNQPVKIHSLEIENVKRVQAVSFSLSPDGLTLIGGNNGEGKTSILDSIAFALGGGNKKPSNIKREGSVSPPKIKITLTNGLIAERKGKNSALTVTDPTGNKSGQTLLDSFISELALDLPKFMNANDKKKAETLLSIIGVKDELELIDHKEKELTDERLLCGRELKSKEGHAEQITFYPDLPEVPQSVQDLLAENEKILVKNAENKRLRDNVQSIANEGQRLSSEIEAKKAHREELQKLLDQCDTDITNLSLRKDQKSEEYKVAKTSTEKLHDESTEAIQEKLRDIEDINTKIRSNLEYQTAHEDFKSKKAEYDEFTKSIDKLRKDRQNLLEGAELPLPELSIQEGKLTYKGQLWDCMSGAEQLIVSCAIVRKLKPECGFVLTDKLEQMDSDTLKSFHEWLVQEGLQNIGTIVGKREECQIIIEDGLISDTRTVSLNKQEPKINNSWGSFS